jgi:modulator of FtsH protease HflC
MTRRLLLILLVPLFLAWGLSAFYTVDRAEFAYVTRFGQPVVTRDGASDAGLHVKWPWPVESVQRLDRRLQVFDLAPTESLTPDPHGQGQRTIDRTIMVDAYVCWRIPDAAAADRFLRTVRTPEYARDLLGQRISSRLSTVLSTMPLDELIAVADAPVIDARMERLRRRILGEEPAGPAEALTGPEDVRAFAREAYGIEVVDVRLRRFNYPENVRPAIAERIISERRRKAAEYESAGLLKAREIESAATRDAAMIVAKARAEEQRLRRQADVDAERIRNEAHARDRAFYEFLQRLRAYQEMLARTQDVLLLSTRHEFFEMFLKPPKPGSASGVNGAATPPANSTPRSGGP